MGTFDCARSLDESARLCYCQKPTSAPTPAPPTHSPTNQPTASLTPSTLPTPPMPAPSEPEPPTPAPTKQPTAAAKGNATSLPVTVVIGACTRHTCRMMECPSGCDNDGSCFCTGGRDNCTRHWNQCEGEYCACDGRTQ